MRNPKYRWLRRSGRIAIALAFGAGAIAALGLPSWRRPASALAGLPRAVARRTDLKVSILTGGRVESAHRTVVTCDLENLQLRSQGHALTVSGSSTILNLVPDGSMVKRGDVLCQLDSSDYEELVRDQAIKVEQARAVKLEADLDEQVAEMAVREFQEGLQFQLEQEYKGQLAMARSEVERATDRIGWSTRMLAKRYVAASQVSSDRTALMRAQMNLRLIQGELDNFRRFTVPITMKTLLSQVEGAKANVVYQTMRLQRQSERLKHYQEQVDLCTIRAPHDGFAIYANDRDREVRIEEGATVRQRQNLFYLPDLSDMEVETMIHESVVDRVQDGMRARVEVEALPGRLIEGHVVSVSRLPLFNHSSIGSDVKNYLGLVKLDSVPQGLRPGMTAEVEIVTADRPEALVIPPTAVLVENGEDFCYVARGEEVERRRITLGSSTHALLEVTEGLSAGEEVVVDPARGNVASASEQEGLDQPATNSPGIGAEVPALH